VQKQGCRQQQEQQRTFMGDERELGEQLIQKVQVTA
jgi:hypothetical protein